MTLGTPISAIWKPTMGAFNRFCTDLDQLRRRHHSCETIRKGVKLETRLRRHRTFDGSQSLSRSAAPFDLDKIELSRWSSVAV